MTRAIDQSVPPLPRRDAVPPHWPHTLDLPLPPLPQPGIEPDAADHQTTATGPASQPAITAG